MTDPITVLALRKRDEISAIIANIGRCGPT
jgi:hypothetical protein